MKKIIFDGMGVKTDKTDVGNYRIMSHFINNKNEQCFVEIAHFRKNDELYAMIRQAYKDIGETRKHYFKTFDDMYNIDFLYTKENVLKSINSIFQCNFDDLEVVHYDGKFMSKEYNSKNDLI